jgi:type I restriction enzyme S subunit
MTLWDEKRETSNVWLSIADLLNGEDSVVLESKEHISDKGASGCKLVRKGTLLVSFKLTLGRLAFAGRDLYTNEAIAALTIIDTRTIHDRFLFYYLHFFDWAKAAEGEDKIKGKTLNKAKLKEVIVEFPSIAEQLRIVAILDTAFEGIDKAVSNTAKNLAHARELFETSIIAGLFGDPVAQRWRPTTVENLATAEKGSIRTGPFGSQLLHGEFVDEGVAVLGIDNAVMNQFQWAKRRFITPDKYAELTRYTVKPGDVLITIMGTCGRCAVVPDDVPLAINSKHLCCITVNKEKCLPQFLQAYFLYHPVARAFLASRAKGSIMEGLNMGIIRELPVWLPSLQVQTDVLSRLKTLEANIQALQSVYEQKLGALSELKQALLGKAFSGELTAHPETALPEAAE